MYLPASNCARILFLFNQAIIANSQAVTNNLFIGLTAQTLTHKIIVNG